jgi:hypothetical protein
MDDQHLIPEELFDGWAVYRAMPEHARESLSSLDVSHVLDAVVALIRQRLANHVGAQRSEENS